MKLPSLRTLAMIAVAILLIIGLLWMRSCQAEREAKRQAELQRSAREADGAAAKARQEDITEIHRNQEELENVLAPIPDAGLSDRQHARACELYRQQRGAVAPGCGPHPGTGAAPAR